MPIRFLRKRPTKKARQSASANHHHEPIRPGSRIRDHPNYSKKHAELLAELEARDGEKKALKLLGHRRFPKSRAEKILGLAREYGIPKTIAALNVAKTDHKNIEHVLAASREAGLPRTLKIWRSPRANARNIGPLSQIGKEHGAVHVVSALEDPKVRSVDDVKILAPIIKRYGKEAATEAFYHKKTTPHNIAPFAAALNRHGRDDVLRIANRSAVDPDNLRNVSVAIVRHGPDEVARLTRKFTGKELRVASAVLAKHGPEKAKRVFGMPSRYRKPAVELSLYHDPEDVASMVGMAWGAEQEALKCARTHGPKDTERLIEDLGLDPDKKLTLDLATKIGPKRLSALLSDISYFDRQKAIGLIKKHGLATATSIIRHPKLDDSMRSDYLYLAEKYGPEEALSLLNHKKFSPHNIFRTQVLAHPPSEVIPLLDDPKVTPENQDQLFDAVEMIGPQATRHLLASPTIKPDIGSFMTMQDAARLVSPWGLSKARMLLDHPKSHNLLGGHTLDRQDPELIMGLLDHPKLPNYLIFPNFSENFGARDLLTLLDSEKITPENSGDVIHSLDSKSPGHVKRILDGKGVHAGNLAEVLDAAEQHGVDVALHVATLGDIPPHAMDPAIRVYKKKGAAPLKSIIQHPKIDEFNMRDILGLAEKKGTRVVADILDHEISTRNNLGTLSTYAKDARTRDLRRLLRSPSLRGENLSSAIVSAKRNGIENTIKAMEISTNPQEIGHIASTLKKYPGNELESVLSHPAVTADSRRFLLGIIGDHGPGPLLRLLSMKKDPQLINEAISNYTFARLPPKAIRAILASRRTGKKDVYGLMVSARNNGLKPTLAAWNSRSSFNRHQVSDVAKAISQYGYKRMKPILEHEGLDNHQKSRICANIEVVPPEKVLEILKNGRVDPRHMTTIIQNADALDGRGLNELSEEFDLRGRDTENLAKLLLKHDQETTRKLLSLPMVQQESDGRRVPQLSRALSLSPAIERHGFNAMLPIIEHEKIRPRTFDSLSGVSEKASPAEMGAVLDNPKVTESNAYDVFRGISKSDVPSISALTNDPYVTEDNLAAFSGVVAAHGLPETTRLIGIISKKHSKNDKIVSDIAKAAASADVSSAVQAETLPKAEKALTTTAQAIKEHGLETVADLLNDNKISDENADHLMNLVLRHSPDKVRELISLPEVTAENLGTIANSVRWASDIDPFISAIRFPKVTPDSLPSVAGAISKHGEEKVKAILDEPKVTVENAGPICALAEKNLGSANNLLKRVESTPENLAELSSYVSLHGIGPTFDIWGMEGTGPSNTAFLIAARKEYPDLPKERYPELLRLSWKDVADGRLDIASLPEPERVIVCTNLAKAADPQKSYAMDFNSFVDTLNTHADMSQTPEFTMDKKIAVSVAEEPEVIRPKMASALKLTPHFSPTPFESQVARALDQLGHKDGFLRDIGSGNIDSSSKGRLTDLLESEGLGSLDPESKDETVRRIVSRTPNALLPFVSHIASSHGFGLRGFDTKGEEERFNSMAEFFADVAPEFFSDSMTPELQSHLKSLQSRFETKTRGRTSKRTVRLYSGKKSAVHSLYSILGETCIRNYDENTFSGRNNSADPNFSPTVMFDDKTGELMGVVYLHADKGGGRLNSFGFEPLSEVTDKISSKKPFIQKTYAAIATAAAEQGMGLHASAESGQVSNRNAFISIIKGLGRPYEESREVIFPKKDMVSSWLDLSHLAKAPVEKP